MKNKAFIIKLDYVIKYYAKRMKDAGSTDNLENIFNEFNELWFNELNTLFKFAPDYGDLIKRVESLYKLYGELLENFNKGSFFELK